MARYIDADKLKKRIYASPMFLNFGEDGFFIRDAVLDLIEKFPIAISTADVAEVKHGEWEKRGNEKKCSVCDFIYYSNNDEWNFCPNCGAKMDGGKI